MKKSSFQTRLQAAQVAGNLSTADLAIWFARPYHTVRGWIIPRTDRDRREGYAPWGPHRDEILRRLENLERFVRHNKTPYVLGPHERIQWLKQVTRDFNGAVSSSRSAS
jgi:hypothetical protein